MKRLATRTITVLSLVAALGISVPGTAFGDSSNSSANSAIGAPTPWAAWHKTWVAHFDGLKSINLSYRSSVESARSAYLSATAAGDPPPPPAGYNGTAYVIGIQAANVDLRASATAAQGAYTQALASATTNTQRRAARLSLETAIGNAIIVRSSALLALGPPPSHPGQPSSYSSRGLPSRGRGNVSYD